MHDTTLIHAAYVLPVRPERVVLERHCVAIQDGRIRALLPSPMASRRYAGANEIDLGHHVLMPGLINMHTHSPMTLFRGYADDRDMQSWLKDAIWPLEARFVSHAFVADGTRLAMAEMIRAGTTCFNDNYFFPDAMADAVHDAGMRARIGLPLIEMASAWAEDIDDYFDKGLELTAQFHGESLIEFSLAPHAPYTVGDATLDRIGILSAERGWPVHMHLLETAWEVEQSKARYAKSPLERLDARGLLNERLLAVHMTQLAPGDIQLLAERGVNVIHCPESNLKLASGICPLPALLEAGINVAIGTDGAASNNDLDLLGEARTAALLAKGVAGSALRPDAFEVLEMLTINAARALGMGDRVGSIEIGKQADLAALDVRHVRTQPVHQVLSSLIYSASSSQFSDVWVDGRRLLQAGCLTTLDEDAIISRAAEWQGRIAASPRSPGMSDRDACNSR